MPKTYLFFLAFFIALTAQNLGTPTARAEESVADGTGVSILDDPDYDPNNPYFYSIKPKWAIGFRLGVHGVPTSGAVGDTYQLFGEYLFPFQKMGIFSAGIHGGLFPLQVDNGNTIPYPNYGNFAVGITARYQAAFSGGQWVVPTIGLEWDYYRVKQDFVSDTEVTGNYASILVGVMLNLGVIDTQTARDAYQSIGLLRSYLTVEIKSNSITNSAFTLSGASWLFGIRLEFE